MTHKITHFPFHRYQQKGGLKPPFKLLKIEKSKKRLPSGYA
jgi:hypothetical protein